MGRRIARQHCLFLHLILFSFLHALQADSLPYSNSDTIYNLKGCKLFPDSNGLVVCSEIDEIFNRHDSTFDSFPVNYGYITVPVWLMIPPQGFKKDVVIRFRHALLDTVEVYVADFDSCKYYTSCGLLADIIEPAVCDRNAAFLIPEEMNTKTFFVKIQTTDVCAIDAQALGLPEFISNVRSANMLYGLYFGAVLILAVVNFFLFFTARYSSSLWYSLYILTFATFQLFSSGFVEKQYLFGNAFFLKNATPFFASLCLFFGSFFTRDFLNLSTEDQKTALFAWIYKVFIIAGGILTIVALFGGGTLASEVVSVAASLFVMTSLVASITRIASLGRPAIFYTTAISLLAIGVIANSIRNYGFLPNNFFTAHGNIIGSVLEFLIIAIGLVDRISSIERDKNDAIIETQYAKQLATESSLKTLQAQINPHFLFNTLNVLAELVALFPKQAEELVLSLSKFFRYTLTVSSRKMVKLSEEIEIIRTYLSIEKCRYGKRLKYEIDVDGDVEKVFIVGMILQPIVENSVKHGIGALPKGGVVSIRVTVGQNNVTIRIHDSGAGFGSSKKHGTSHGLYNIKERLQLAYGNRAEMSCSNVDGALVELVVPVRGDDDV